MTNVMSTNNAIYRFMFVLPICLSSGCSTLPRNPVPVEGALQAQIPGIPNARAWLGTFSRQFEDDLLLSVRQASSSVASASSNGFEPIDVLSISGGGGYGAFGAGFLQGWSKSGLRPEFKLVTGISSGALIAPFAFLGAEYDGVVREAFTTTSARDVFIPRWLSFLWNDAFADSTPLAKLIRRHITVDVMQAIAREHQRGRRLFIGTTNLDADRLVVWNMGAIAGSGKRDALELFRQIILASSSVPGAFPPVMIDVELGGARYDEMHVDGGVKAQLFLLAATLDIASFRKKLGVSDRSGPRSRVFVIRNAEVGPEPEQVPRNLADISERAISSLIKVQALSDLERVYRTAKEQNLAFYWVGLPASYEPSGREEFDTEEMNDLFQLGYSLGVNKNPWQATPFLK